LIATDITQDLYEQLERQFIEPLLDIPSFVKNEATRKTYARIFNRILQSWEGNFALCLEGALDDKIRQTLIMNTKQSNVRQYIRSHLPFMCKSAKKVRGLYGVPITKFIFSFIKQSEKFNENGKFELNDWDQFLAGMKTHVID
jgi:hypothetical protein